MGYNNGGRSGYGSGGGQSGFEPKPGSGTLFVKANKTGQAAPDYDGYFIVDRDLRAGEKVKLVGWDKQGNKGHMINLKLARERQDAPGFNGQPQQGYQQPPQQGYAPRQQQGYQGPHYSPPSQGQQPQGGGHVVGYSGGQPTIQPYQPPQAAPTVPAAPAPNYAFPPPANTDLPF